MKTGAVIVAAGMLSCMGDFKPMLKIGAISMAKELLPILSAPVFFQSLS